jgi:superfamily II DNA or RNA helicase
LQEQFIKAGVAADYQDAYTKSEARHLIRHRFHSGDIKVVCNVGTLTTGVDWDVRCIVVARPTKSEMLHVQIIGRGLRTAEGKDYCLILDHSDNHIRLGFVTDINHPDLDDGREPRAKQKAEDTIKLPRPCVGCKALLPPKTKVCPACGFEHQPRNGAIVCADGELLELDRATRQTKPALPARERLIAMGEQSVYSQLLHVRLIRGYKPGWAFYKFIEIFGHDPSGLNTHQMLPPTPEMKSWIKHKQIEYAKAKEKQPELAL